MPHGAIAAVGKDERATVEEPPQVALEPAEVVALSVHHRQPQPSGGEPVPGPSLAEDVLGRALAYPVIPFLPVAGRRGRDHQRPLVIRLARRRGARLAHEVDLARADHHVVADAVGQRSHRFGGFLAPKDGEVHRGVEAAPGQEPREVSRRPIAAQPLHPLAEGIAPRPAVEERDAVASREQAQGSSFATTRRPDQHQQLLVLDREGEIARRQSDGPDQERALAARQTQHAHGVAVGEHPQPRRARRPAGRPGSPRSGRGRRGCPCAPAPPGPAAFRSAPPAPGSRR